MKILEPPKVGAMRKWVGALTVTPTYRSLSCNAASSLQRQLSTVATTTRREESFTIYIGAQLKTMHNIRLLLCERMANLCQLPHQAEAPSTSPLVDKSSRLNLLMVGLIN